MATFDGTVGYSRRRLVSSGKRACVEHLDIAFFVAWRWSMQCTEMRVGLEVLVEN